MIPNLGSEMATLFGFPVVVAAEFKPGEWTIVPNTIKPYSEATRSVEVDLSAFLDALTERENQAREDHDLQRPHQ